MTEYIHIYIYIYTWTDYLGNLRPTLGLDPDSLDSCWRGEAGGWYSYRVSKTGLNAWDPERGRERERELGGHLAVWGTSQSFQKPLIEEYA